jgi:hypothetical protein
MSDLFDFTRPFRCTKAYVPYFVDGESPDTWSRYPFVVYSQRVVVGVAYFVALRPLWRGTRHGGAETWRSGVADSHATVVNFVQQWIASEVDSEADWDTHKMRVCSVRNVRLTFRRATGIMVCYAEGLARAKAMLSRTTSPAPWVRYRAEEDSLSFLAANKLLHADFDGLVKRERLRSAAQALMGIGPERAFRRIIPTHGTAADDGLSDELVASHEGIDVLF